MKIALIDKAPGKFNYQKAFGMEMDVYHLTSQEGLKRVLKKDVDIQINVQEYDWVILCGSEAVKNYTKVTSVTDYSGRQTASKDGSYTNFIVSISPAAMAFKPEIKPVFEDTLNKIYRLINGAETSVIKNTILPVRDTELALQTLNTIKTCLTLQVDQPILAFDTETSALYARKGHVLGISLSHTYDFGTYIDADCFDDTCVAILQEIIDNPRCQVVGHNAKFDIHMLRYHFNLSFDKAFAENRLHDTMVLHYMLDERQGTHGLKQLALKYTDLGAYDDGLDQFKKEYCKTHGIKEEEFTYDLIPWDIIYPYACLTHDSKVYMADGTTKSIGELVRTKSTEQVLSYNEDTGIIEPKQIIGWHKNEHKSKEWFKLDVYTGSKTPRDNRTGVINGPAFTADHKIFTQRGWVQVKDLNPGQDSILSQEKALTSDQLEMVYGSLMGDGQLVSRNGNGAGLTLYQGKEHKEYGSFKAEMLEQELLPSTKGGVKVVTQYSALWTDLYRQLPIRGNTSNYKIRFPEEFAHNNLGWKFLTIWYLDDGNLTKDNCPRIWSRTISEYVDDITSIINWAKNKLNINLRYHNDGLNNQFFLVEPESRTLFFTEIAKLIPSEDMLYKVPEKYHQYFTFGNTWKFGFSKDLYFSKLYGVEQWNVPDSRKGYATKWCIDVEDNHNFYTPIGLVHNCLDTVATIRLFLKFWPIVQKNEKLLYAYKNIMMPGIQFLQEVEDNGVPVSINRLLKAKEVVTDKITKATEKLYSFKSVRDFEQIEGKIFNPNSPIQLRTLLFDYEKLKPTGKLTGTGAVSTDAEVLEILSEKSKLATVLLEIRKYKKLLSTYIEKMLDNIDTDGRLRTGFNLTSTTSGRLSSSGTINLQQLPSHDYLIKGCIKARKGYKIVALDRP